jgi:hypothetical protein
VIRKEFVQARLGWSLPGAGRVRKHEAGPTGRAASRFCITISAIIIQPVELDGRVVLLLGAELQGSIVRVRRIGLGFSHETALLDLRFDTLILADGLFW